MQKITKSPRSSQHCGEAEHHGPEGRGVNIRMVGMFLHKTVEAARAYCFDAPTQRQSNGRGGNEGDGGKCRIAERSKDARV